MSFAYLPLYTGDYLRDTRHLSPQRHGVFLLLLMYCWDTKSPVPLDEQEASGIANCRSSDEIEALRYILNKYFIKMDDGFYNKRIQNEIEKSESISRVRSEAGRLGYQARAKQLPSKSQANGKHEHLSPSPSLNKPKKKLASFDAESFESFWKLYPKKEAKERARREWAKLSPSGDLLAAIMRGVVDFPYSSEYQYIHLGSNWLADRRWEDEGAQSRQSAMEGVFLP